MHHRRIQADTRQWVEFDGTLNNRLILDGTADIEEHWLPAPNGTYRALGLRSYDAKTDLWTIRWVDGRDPALALDPPAVKGRFENGVGRFYSEYEQNGVKMMGRLMWSNITPTSARWEQAASADGGKTWAANWIFEIQRVSPAPAPTPLSDAPRASSSSGVRDFDFLRGRWRVRHRYLRVRGAAREWVEIDGMVVNSALMEGAANLEEHTFLDPRGTTRAFALRAYDPKTQEWSIWWLDGRDPGLPMDPAMHGRFVHDVGTFYGTQTVAGKPVKARFIWSEITPTSARWEQSYSYDDGKSWEVVWVMEFHRAE